MTTPRRTRVYKEERALRKQKRDRDICRRFDELCQKHPQWRIDAIFDKIGEEFYLSPDTIYHITLQHAKQD